MARGKYKIVLMLKYMMNDNFDMTYTLVGGGRVPTGVEARPAFRGAIPRRRLRPGLRQGAVLRHPVRISHRKGELRVHETKCI